MASILSSNQAGVVPVPHNEGSTAEYLDRINEELNLLDDRIENLAGRAADYLYPEPLPTKVVEPLSGKAQSENAARLAQIHGRLSYLSERLHSIIDRFDS